MENENGTIHEDVSNENAEKQDRPLSAREQMFEQISNKIDEQRQGEVVAEETTTTTDTANVRVLNDPQMLVRVKVNGKELDKPLADVLTGYQKNEAASERLRQAATKEKELEAREKALLDNERQVQLQTQSSSDEDTDEVVLSALTNLVDGDTETAAKLLRNAINKGRTTVTTPQAIDEDALIGRIEQKQEGKKAWDTFLSQNPEFANEQSKERQYGDYLFATKYRPLLESGELSYHQALMDTANEVKGTFAQPQATKTPREVKQERKQSIDNLPIASGARQSGAAQEQEETHSSIITQMRKGRGLPV
jgi:hypothetical protein